jgi:hypothetical protein
VVTILKGAPHKMLRCSSIVYNNKRGQTGCREGLTPQSTCYLRESYLQCAHNCADLQRRDGDSAVAPFTGPEEIEMKIQDVRLGPEPRVCTEVGRGGMMDHGGHATSMKGCFD